jgi:hypothetical protein
MIVRPMRVAFQPDIAKRCGVILTKNGVEVVLRRTVDDVTLFELMDDHSANKLDEIQDEECYSSILSSVTSEIRAGSDGGEDSRCVVWKSLIQNPSTCC